MDRRARRLESQLCKAVTDGDPRSVQLLLSEGARPDLVGSRGVAAIHLAVGKETEKNIRCLKTMLQHGADPNVRSSEGLTPLHVAALWGCYQNLKLLLMNGGNPTAKDNEGNTPGQLAEQQDNRRCAHLLQDYQSNSGDTEEEELPQFQYSVYSDHTDLSSYPDSDCTFTSHSSRISDFGEAPFSSTRRSSFFNLSVVAGRPASGVPHHGFSEPSILSSTRMSAVGAAAHVSFLKEEGLCTDEDMFMPKQKELHATTNCTSPSRRDTLPAFHSTRASRKSVSFRDVDEYFPVFSPESQQERPEGSQSPGTDPCDTSQYSGFLDSERMATVLPQQGIDVTSPDHVYVFCRESSESTEEDLEKTVMSRCLLEDSDDDDDDEEQEEGSVKTAQVNAPTAAVPPAGSSGSGTGSSHYSSCDSDHYTSALSDCVCPKHLSRPLVEGSPAATDSDRNQHVPGASESEPTKPGEEALPGRTEGSTETMQPVAALLGAQHQDADSLEAGRAHAGPSLRAESVPTLLETKAAVGEGGSLPFTPSPFVTGRTRSRLSRCSLRTSRTPESLHLSSSLFEETLPAPVRACRHTPRSQSREDLYSTPQPRCFTPSHSASGRAEEPPPADLPDTQSCTLGVSVSNSQADTLILSKPAADSPAESQTLCDTVVLERNLENSIDAYERNLAEVLLAIQGQRRITAEEREPLTDDVTSADERAAEQVVRDPGDDQDDEVFITDDCSSEKNSASSSSSSSYFSPRRSEQHSDPPDPPDPPCTPGTGCTPRYSVSRLSTCRRPQHLAHLSCTPGGRALIQDLSEPVEYLYTDTEQGHRLIEAHVPPTADTSLSSSLSTASSEETILYDWRSLHSALKAGEGKENQRPAAGHSAEGAGGGEDQQGALAQTRGLTDKELRVKLLELGESPGPISSRTRPTYMRRLCRLLQETHRPGPEQQEQREQREQQEQREQREQQEQREQPAPDLGFSPELCRVLRTFALPSCQADEQSLCQQFDQPDQNRKWREGIIKSSFNYLLLDPRVTKNLPFRSHTMTPHECFHTFVNAVFYVGKGKRSRPYSHLYEALEYYTGDKTSKKLCPKVQHILQVWSVGQGVVSLHCFQNVIPVEAYTREACMVEAMGLKMLTNQKRGDFYGVVSNWQLRRKRELGVHLLYRAMQIFLAEGERQLRPADIRQ